MDAYTHTTSRTFLDPVSSIPTILRIGKLGDGGKVVCSISRYERESPGPSSDTNTAPPLVVYSFGVSDDSSFEAALLNRTNAEVWEYDYVVDSWAADIPNHLSSRAHFHQGDHGRPTLPFGQLLIEIHFMKEGPDFSIPKDLEAWMKWWSAMEETGVTPVNNEDSWIGDAVYGKLRFMEVCHVELAEEVPVTNGFCGDCQDLFDNWPDLNDPESKDSLTGLNWPGAGADWKHAVARDCRTLVLEAAARNGCRFYALLVQAMRDAGLLDIFRRIEARLEYIGNKTTASLSVQKWGTTSSQLLCVNFPGRFVTISMVVSRQTRNFTQWLWTFLNALPTRLVSVAGDVPRLVLTAGWETRPRYSTLSYCWGNEGFLRLTAENYDSFLTKIPTEELPKTFRDAIHITRELGSVYGGSFINIAAASAVNVHQGCFLKPPHLVDGLRASITVNGSKFVREIRRRDSYAMATMESYLATRAWALQEKILAPRTIHFGNRGAFWECRIIIANEFLPDGFPRHLGTGLINDRRRKEHFGSWWSEVVSPYSAADLTYSQDTLPALSGIARRSYHGRGGQYLAGMWREEKIEAQLCWRVTDPRKRPPWRAPSWSWASADGRVVYNPTQPGNLEDTYGHVVDAEVTFLGDDPFGDVRSWWLRIGCSGMLAAEFSDGKTVKIESDDGEMSADGDFPVFQDCLDDGWEKRGGTVYLLPLFGGRTGSRRRVFGDDGEERELIDEMLVCGIILRSADGAAGQFYRIGMFNFWRNQIDRGIDRKERGFYDAFLRAFEQGAKALGESVCAEVIEGSEYPDERYIISII
ncbi:hypothetical protein DL766_007768 [Monosporascus sp. MC13-8B]|nr:hypothetical protein DL763_000585 [Monosporascus cannonballus]RYP22210.1 hypothetical protein DL766_007768 [Monosporascus sp. MC13-8B]